MFAKILSQWCWILCTLLSIANLVVSVGSESAETSDAAAVRQQQAHDFEIRSLSGEPDYKSVNLTWEIEDIQNDIESQSAESKEEEDGGQQKEDGQHKQHGIRAFTVFYCELQTWGLHRCKSKNLIDNDNDNQSKMKQYSMIIKNLRMATKYSFHVKQQQKPGEQKVTGRADLGDNELGPNGVFQGQTIIIPTKGFSAHATRCLPDVSEIEVETGPYFGGRIAAENGNCGIQGDPNDPRDIYTMKIEHDKCGSRVSTEDLTVETFITVQENLGILTHSTRRYLVVCTFQPDTLTVRARLALPGKGGATAVNSEFWPENGRSARTRQFKMVNKTSLVLKTNNPEAYDEDVSGGVTAEDDEENSVGTLEQFIPQTSDSIAARKKAKNYESEFLRDASYAARLYDRDFDNTEHTTQQKGYFHSDITGLVIAICLTMIMIGAFIYVLQRESKKQKHNRDVRHQVQ